MQWDGHYGTINTVQQLKHELAYKAPAAFLPPPSSTSKAPVIGPSSTAPPPSAAVAVPRAPVVAHYSLPGTTVYSTSAAAPPPPPLQMAAAGGAPTYAYAPPPPPMTAAVAMGAVPSMQYGGGGGAPPPPPPLAAAIAQPFAAPPPLPMYGAEAEEPSAKKARVDGTAPVEQGKRFDYYFSVVAVSSHLHIIKSNNLFHRTSVVTLMPAAEFAAQYGDAPITIHMQLPPADAAAGPATWNLQGQCVAVSLPVTSSVKQVKEAAAAQHLGGMPASKQQLRTAAQGFLKDAATLAELNIGDGAVLELSVKSRGGKR